MTAPFLSYAQNFEDVILWRALGHVRPGQYIDIGAADPIDDSVSYAFYQRGWRGIHVEPVHANAERLRTARPDELVFEAMVGVEHEQRSFYQVGSSGLSTARSEYAAQHRNAGFDVSEMKVRSVSLATVLEASRPLDVHWMKIDVEGMEAEVLATWAPSDVRPWIVLVESTLPNSTVESFKDWEGNLEGLGYEFVYFDGLNRFYVSEAHSELKSAFGAGPNFFDNFAVTEKTPAGQSLAHEINRLREEANTLNSALQQGPVEIARQIDVLLQRLEAVHHASLHHDKLILERLEANHRDVLARIGQLEVEVAATKRKSAAQGEAIQVQIAATRAHQVQLEQANAHQASVIAAMRSSTSWRLTAPVRGLSHLAAGARRGASSVAKAVVRAPLEAGLRFGRRHPPLARFAIRSFGAMPVIGPRVMRFAQVRGYNVPRPVTAADELTIDAAPESLAYWRDRLSTADRE